LATQGAGAAVFVAGENRLLVTVHWLWLYLTYERGARLITGGEDTEL